MRAFRLADDLPARHPPQVDRVASSAEATKSRGRSPGVGVARGKIYWGTLMVLYLHKLPPAVPINPSDWKD